MGFIKSNIIEGNLNFTGNNSVSIASGDFTAVTLGEEQTGYLTNYGVKKIGAVNYKTFNFTRDSNLALYPYNTENYNKYKALVFIRASKNSADIGKNPEAKGLSWEIDGHYFQSSDYYLPTQIGIIGGDKSSTIVTGDDSANFPEEYISCYVFVTWIWITLPIS